MSEAGALDWGTVRDVAATWMRAHGFTKLDISDYPTSGTPSISSGQGAAMVRTDGPVEASELAWLIDYAQGAEAFALVFCAGGYTQGAVDVAEEEGVALFRVEMGGEGLIAHAANHPAERLFVWANEQLNKRSFAARALAVLATDDAPALAVADDPPAATPSPRPLGPGGLPVRDAGARVPVTEGAAKRLGMHATDGADDAVAEPAASTTSHNGDDEGGEADGLEGEEERGQRIEMARLQRERRRQLRRR